ncbi:MAG: hypothetical protein JJE40_11440 [Vicinamibacteria bacterium]|nr:hypothetical protein [Vicinamibacteria bacterium]
MRRLLAVLIAGLASAVVAPQLTAAEGIVGHVVRIEQKKQCLFLEWDNDTEKTVCWTEKTAFSVLETGKAAKATDVRKGSYLRLQGDEKNGTYWATEVVIWQEASKPAGQ